MKFFKFIFLTSILFSALVQSQDFSSKTSSGTSLSSLLAFSGISVTVGGNFPINGSFSASPSERVDQFVTRLILQISEQTKNVTLMNAFPLRDIRLKRTDGSEIKIDLLRYRNSGDLSLNPYLKNDDFILFPTVNVDKNFITIYGAVNEIQKIQFVDGDKLSDALFFAHGIDKSYDKINSIEIRRMKSDGDLDQVIIVKDKEDILLQRGDRIRINADENSKSDYKAYVFGEVKSPGIVAITKNSTTFKSLLERVGGLNSDASLGYAALLRGNSTINILKKSIYKNEIQSTGFDSREELEEFYKSRVLADLYEMTRMSSLTNEDTLSFAIDNKLRFINQNDFANLIDLSDPNSDLSNSIVNDGDILIIPKKPTNVYVFGQVGKTGNIPFKQGADYKYYINLASGIGEEAKDDVYLIKGKTRHWIKVSENNQEIEPGDFIWIPKNIKYSWNYYLQVTASIMGIVGTVATVALLVVQLGK